MPYQYELQIGAPLRGNALSELTGFLAGMGLTFSPGCSYTVLLRGQDGRILATGSLEGDIVKCVAVAPEMQGEGLTAAVLTALRSEAHARGLWHLFLYTKPRNFTLFSSLGFYEIARTADVLLMEDTPCGLQDWADRVRRPHAAGTVGAVVLNANPMTLGHLHLVETAASRCDFLYVFVVSEDKSAVPFAHRLAIVTEAAAHLPHVFVTGTDRYLISAATFPDYFLKDKSRSPSAWAALDGAVFCRLANMLGISRRFVGSEPLCPVTEHYNRIMQEFFPAHGITLSELPRLTQNGTAISATEVRRLVAENRWQEVRPLVPDATYRYLSVEAHRQELCRRMLL